MKIKVPQTISNVGSFEDLRKYSDQIFSQLVTAVNGRIDFNDNLYTSIVSFTFDEANKNYQVNHSLGKIPIGYLPISKSISTDIYTGVGTSTDSFIFLKSTVANATVSIMVF